MKQTMLALALFVFVGGAGAQDRIPDEEAKKIAKVLLEAASKLKAPLTVDADADKPFAKRKDDHGAMLIPARTLTAEIIEKAGQQIAPVGMLCVRNLTLVADGKLLPAKSFQTVTVTHNDNEVTIGVGYVGVQKVKDKPSLVVLGHDKKPLLTVPLEKAEQKQEYPLEFLVTVVDERAEITVMVLGKYKGKLQVGPPAE